VKENSIIVNLKGKAMFNVEGILQMLNDKSAFRHHALSDRMTILDPKRYTQSLLYHSLGEIITHAKEIESMPGWFGNEWSRMHSDGSPYNGTLDILYADEFEFLVSEGLLIMKSHEELTQDEIFKKLDESCQAGDLSDIAPQVLMALTKDIVIS
jgi:hypothetical protein